MNLMDFRIFANTLYTKFVDSWTKYDSNFKFGKKTNLKKKIKGNE